jgi:hypothetical protein
MKWVGRYFGGCPGILVVDLCKHSFLPYYSPGPTPVYYDYLQLTIFWAGPEGSLKTGFAVFSLGS